MAFTFNWTVNNMTSYPKAAGYENVVVKVNWSCDCTDGTYNNAIVGNTEVILDNSGTYTPYADLTQSQVIGWVQSALGTQEVATTQNLAAEQLAAKFYIPTILPNPWA